MAEYIDREKMLKCLEEINTADEWIVGQYNADWIYSFIESQPSADVVEVKRGEWKKVREGYPRYVCTRCHHLYNNMGYNYCPNCGAKMDGGKEE